MRVLLHSTQRTCAPLQGAMCTFLCLALLLTIESAAFGQSTPKSNTHRTEVLCELLDFNDAIRLPQKMIKTGKFIIQRDGSTYLLFSRQAVLSESIVNVYIYNASKVEIESVTLEMPKLEHADREYHIKDFSISGTTVHILIGNAIASYIIHNNTGHLNKVVRTSQSYNRLHLIKNKLIASGCYYDISRADSAYTSIAYCDTFLAAPPVEYTVENPEGVELTLFTPRSVIAASTDDLLIGDLSAYSIKVYDHNHVLKQVLSNPKISWPSYTDTIKSIVRKVGRSRNVKRLIDSLHGLAQTRPAIRRVELLNDTTLIIARQTGQKYLEGIMAGQIEIRYDIWLKRNSGWHLQHSDLKDCSVTLADNITLKRSFPIEMNFSICQDKVARFLPIPSSLFNTCKTYGELMSNLEKILVQDDFYYTLYLYSIKLRD